MTEEVVMTDIEENAGNRLTYFLIGAGIGAAVALLFAPKSGSALRGDLAEGARKSVDLGKQGVHYVEEKATTIASQTAQKAQEVYGQTAQKAQGLLDAGRETVAAKREQLSTAIQAGKQAYVEEKQRGGIGDDTSTDTDTGAARTNA
jgi:gas vesicle protein